MSLIRLVLAAICVHCATAWTNEADGRSLIVLSAPSVWDNHYSDGFLQLIQFTVSGLANSFCSFLGGGGANFQLNLGRIAECTNTLTVISS